MHNGVQAISTVFYNFCFCQANNCPHAAPLASQKSLATTAFENSPAPHAMKVDWVTWLGSDLTQDGSDTDLDFNDVEEEQELDDMSDNE